MTRVISSPSYDIFLFNVAFFRSISLTQYVHPITAVLRNYMKTTHKNFIEYFKTISPIQQKQCLETLLSIHAGNGDLQNTSYPGLPVSVDVIWHNTPDDIMRAYYAGFATQAGVSVDELLSSQTVITGITGEEQEVATTYAIEKQGIEEQGCWGFAIYANPPQIPTPQLHFYVSANADKDMVLLMISQELAHLTPDRHEDETLETLRVGQFSYVSLHAHHIYKDAIAQIKV